MALEYKKYPFAVIMTHTLHGDVNVPNILRLPLHRIKFLDLMRSILTANPTKDLTMHVLRELWGAVLTKVYDYEFGWRKDKKNEVCLRNCSLTITANLLLTIVPGRGYELPKVL